MSGTDTRKPTYEELEEKVHFLEDLVVKLSGRIEELEKKLREKQPPQKPDPPSFVKPSKKGRKKKPGRRKGHKGTSRKKPEHVDETVALPMSQCPDCGTKLGDPFDVREHVQEDIVIVKKKVTAYVRYRYRCARCKKIVEAPPAQGEMPGDRVGPLAKASQRVAARLKPEMDALRAAVRATAALNVDETGWRGGGDNWWLWAFVTKRLALYGASPSRGSKIIFEELGEEYGGIVIADFFSAYNKLDCVFHR